MNKKRAILLAAALLLVVAIVVPMSLREDPKPPGPGPVTPPAAARLVFDPISPANLRRGFDQRLQLSLRNEGDAPARVWVECEPPPDLPSGFVGRGSDEAGAVTIGPDESWVFPFVVHADRAGAREYRIPVVAHADGADARAEVPVAIEDVELRVETHWVEPTAPEDIARLVRTLVVTNLGERVPDFSIEFPGPLAGKVYAHPLVEGIVLGDRVEVRVRPRLHPQFRELSGEIVLRGHGQQTTVPYRVAVPDGRRVHVVMTRSTTVGGNSGSRCTNRREVGYDLPPVDGTPPDPPHRRGGGPVEVSDVDWGGTGLEGFGAALPTEAERNEDDQGLADNAIPATEGVEDTVPPEAFGGDDGNTREVVVRRDGDSMDMLVRRSRGRGEQESSTLDFIPVMGPGRRLRAGVPIVSGNEPARHPTLGPDSAIAYDRPTPDGGSEVVVTKPGGEPRTFGERAARPALLDDEVFWLEDGAVRRARLDGEAEALPIRADADGPFRVRPGPTILSRDGGRLRVRSADGAELASVRADRGDFAMAGDAPVLVHARPDGAIVHGDTVLTPPGWRTADPVLVKTAGGLRLMVHRMFDERGGGTVVRDFVDGAWGDLTASSRIEEPVTDAVVVLNFSLPWARALYKGMNTRVLLNGVEIASLDFRVPNGRFAFPVPANLLRTRAAGTDAAPGNRVDLKVQGVGPGYYHITDVCEIYARHELIQDFLVAASEAEAASLASVTTPDVRHGAPDLLLTANPWEPPQDARPGEELPALIGLFNAGDRPIEGATIVARVGDREIGSAALPALRPFEQRAVIVRIRIPDDWDIAESLLVTFAADVPGDPRPDTNSMTLGLFGVAEPDLAGPGSPGRVDARLLRKAAEVALPAEQPLSGTTRWFKLIVPADGRLKVDVRNIPEDVPVHVEVFGADGFPLGVRPLAGDALYVRVHAERGRTFPDGTTVALSWEAP